MPIDPEEFQLGENATRHARSSNPCAVVSVRFTASEFQDVGEVAERLGIFVTQFIREAALERARKGRI